MKIINEHMLMTSANNNNKIQKSADVQPVLPDNFSNDFLQMIPAKERCVFPDPLA